MKFYQKLLFCVFTLTTYSDIAAQDSKPEIVEAPDQLKVNLDKLDSQIQTLNTSLDEGTEVIKRKQFEESILQYKQGLSEHKKRLEKEQRSRNRMGLLKMIGMVAMIVFAVVNRKKRKETDKLINDALEKVESVKKDSED